MAKIWLKIWLKVKENGTKKIKLAKMVAKEKKILVRTLQLHHIFKGLQLQWSFSKQRNKTYNICNQLRLWSACTSVQADQSLCYLQTKCMNHKHFIGKHHRAWSIVWMQSLIWVYPRRICHKVTFSSESFICLMVCFILLFTQNV